MTDAVPPTDLTPRQPLGQRLAEVLLIVLVFFVMAGDPPPGVNEPHYLCRLKHFWNPGWCAGDLFLESTDTQVAFIWAFGWMTRWLSLSATAWVGRAVAWTLLAWAWQRLSWRLVPRRLAAVLSAGLFVTLSALAHLAGEWVVGGVEAKCFAYFFVLMGLHEMIDRRWNAVWFLFGTACAFHPLVGGWSGLVCAGIWLLDDRREVRPLSMLPGFVAGGLVALVGILPALMLTRNVPADVVAESSRIYVFERLPHHLALLTLPREEATRRFAGHAVLIVALWLMMRGSKALAGLVAPLRPIGQFAWGAILLAIIGLAIEVALWSQPLFAARLLRYYWFRLTDFAVPMAVALYTVAIISAGLERQCRWAMWALTIVLVSVGWQLSSTARQRAFDPVPLADAKVRDFPAWVEACEWIAENTPPDAVFLTPRLSQSFKWRTGRAEVATRKDIPQDAQNMVEWHGRMKNIFSREVNGVTEWVDSPGKLGTERVRQLADQYGFNYILADRGQLLALPVAYKNEEYVVYRVKN
ncbi:MAG: DUF6798 domain-containing protein [Pirellulales bacterium]